MNQRSLNLHHIFIQKAAPEFNGQFCIQRKVVSDDQVIANVTRLMSEHEHRKEIDEYIQSLPNVEDSDNVEEDNVSEDKGWECTQCSQPNEIGFFFCPRCGAKRP
eukprot:145015_1